MTGFILDIIQELASRLASRSIDITKRLPFWVRITVLIAALSATLFAVYPHFFATRISRTRQTLMAAINGQTVPLRRSDAENLDLVIEQLAELLYSAYYKQFESTHPIPLMPAWEAAQVAIALQGLTLPSRHAIRPEPLLTFFARTRASKCGSKGTYCWTETQNGTKRPNMGAASWIMIAKARLGEPADPGEIAFLLEQQNSADGFWTMYPCKDSATASTYATAWAITALAEQLNRGYVPDLLSADVRNSVRSGIEWLEAHRTQSGLWSSYPLFPLVARATETSVSNSGLVVHVLHTYGGTALPDLEHTWMSTLVDSRPPAFSAETFSDWICRQNPQTDSTRYLILPWQLAASVDSYANGRVGERTRALRLVEAIVHDRNSIILEVQQQYFIAAELLVALRNLRDSRFKP